jgi:hypothetical protein
MDHAKTCAECRGLLEDFGQIAAQGLPEIDVGQTLIEVPSGMTERFVARARSQGIPLSPTRPSGQPVLKPAIKMFGMRKVAALAAIAASVVLLFLALDIFERNSRTRFNAASRTVVPDENLAALTSARREIAELKKQLEILAADRKLLVARSTAQQAALDAEDRERAEIGARLAALEKANMELSGNLRDRDSQLAQIKERVNRLQSENEAGRIASVAEENELSNLRETVAQQSVQLEEQRHLDDAARRARDLIVARNLHIVDVYDTDEHGKGQRAFGRIFLTEGKSLIFYAYDLTDPRKQDTKTAFYVWGEKLGNGQTVRNLGIFLRDGGNDQRWVLTFADASVLAEIDSVFVTVESSKKPVTQPSGRRVLYAYLGNKPNHP